MNPSQSDRSTTLLDARALAWHLRVPVGTVYRWAHEDRWPRTSVKRRPVRYDLKAAERSATRRHAGTFRDTCA